MAAYSLLEDGFTSCFVALRGLLDSKSLSNRASLHIQHQYTLAASASTIDGINNAQLEAPVYGATAADLGANAPQWYQSVATPRDGGASTGNNNAMTALRGAGGAVAAANQAQVTPGTATNTFGAMGGSR